MSTTHLEHQAGNYLRKLSLEISNRCVGRTGNREATDFFASTAASFGFNIKTPAFDCIDWSNDGAHLFVGSRTFEALVSPYSLGCTLSAPLVAVSTFEELEHTQAANKILLVRGELAKEQLMPKDFPFYNPDEHQRIIRLLETKNPGAIIAATTKDVEVAGAVYPFPLIEDGDFDIPSVYMTEEEGNKLADFTGQEITLEIRADRRPAVGNNVYARKGAIQKPRVVIFAHIDAKDGTPGAIDNASGVIVLLLLAELMADYSGTPGIELVALNGEDYYSAPGEKQYLADNAGKFSEIILGVNIDGAGYYQGKTAYSLYGCPPDIAGPAHEVFSAYDDIVEGDPWYQSDHSLFIMNKVPALAITSEKFTEIWTHIAHTSKDTPEIIKPSRLVNTALALRELLLQLEQQMI